MSDCDFESLARRESITLMWGFCWRALSIGAIVFTCGAVIGFIFGFVVGMILSAVGLDVIQYKLLIQIPVGLFGLTIGFCSYYYYIRWLLRSQIGSFRLRLIRTESVQSS
jgi:hypothetical protein